MSADLHGTHRWGERRGIPVCLICRAEGYEDEPSAFAPCPGLSARCGAKLKSRDDRGHTHLCTSVHESGHHFCWECGRWFGLKGDK